MAAVAGALVLPRRGEHRVGRLDGDEGLGQPVADGLEAADRPAELDALEGVLAGEVEHRAGGAHQLVAEGELAERHGRGPCRGRPVRPRRRRARPPVTSHQAEPTDRCRRSAGASSVGGGHDARRRRRRRRSATTRRLGGAGQRRGAEAVDVGAARRRRACPGGAHRPSAGSTTDVGLGAEPERARQDVVERRGRGVGRALQLEEQRDRGVRVDRQRVGPAQLVEGGVERGAGVVLGGVAQAPLEQLEIGRRPSPAISCPSRGRAAGGR